MELQKGHRANAEMLKQLGYKKLSRTQWVKDGVKVQVILGRIHSIINQTSFKQTITGFKKRC